MDPALYLHSNSSRPPLRIGVLLNSSVLSTCFIEVLRHIERCDFANLELAIFNSAAVDATPASLGLRVSKLRKSVDLLRDKKRRSLLLYALYRRWDDRQITHEDNPVREEDCSIHLKTARSISVAPIKKRFVDRFPENAIRDIKGENLDVLLRFGFNILRGDILQCAKYGVWSYHHGDNEFYRGGPACFWEVVEGNPVSGVILQILTEELDAGKILYKGLFATEPGFSCARNRLQPYWGASTFVVQKLHELHEKGWEKIEQEIVPSVPYQGKKKLYTAPQNSQMVRWLAPYVIGKSAIRAARLLQPARSRHWMMGFGSGNSINPTSESDAPDLRSFPWIDSPRGHFYADPFLVKWANRNWVFFEDFDYGAQQGWISCAEVIGNDRLGEVMPALSRPYHLSYPCVFHDQGELYMIPESAANRTVELYRCAQFPDKWELVKVLFQRQAVDTTIWIENGIYWFFTTLQERHGGTQLRLFWSDSLVGEWHSHPANPLNTDVRRSRCAGALFRHEGKLMRTSQDCSFNYGHSFTFNEITTLNDREFRESPRRRVGPEGIPSLIGIHTYSAMDGIEMIDGWFWVRDAKISPVRVLQPERVQAPAAS
jgi:hypothetical protein